MGMSNNRLDCSTSEPAEQEDKSKNEKENTFQLKAPEPWPELVDGEVLLNDLQEAIQKYVSMQTGCAEASALWILYTHAFEAMTIAPRLAILSPEKQCGKTTLLSVIGCLVPKPLHAANITAAAVFRTIEHIQPTLLIDEADTFLPGADELRGVLNSGHNRATAYTVRLVGDKHEPKQFSTWTPVAIAAIGTLKDTLMDRSIIVQMRRRMASEYVDRFRIDRVKHLSRLSSMCARWAADNLHKLPDIDPEISNGLSDRAADNWRPLLAIAQLAGGYWPDKAMTAMFALNQPNADADGASIGVMLLADIQVVLASYAGKNISSEEIIHRLTDHEFSERPWLTYSKGFPISPRQISNILKPFGIKSDTRHLPDGSKRKGYVVAEFEDAFRRYPPNP
jgi:hypothetical protein